MNRNSFNSGKPLFAQKDSIDDVQSRIAVSGTKVKMQITDETGRNVTVDEAAFIRALGQANYDALIATVKTSISTAIASAETTLDTAITALT